MQVQKRGKNLDKKLWLARYRELRDEADEWKDESDRLRNQLFPSASIITGMPRNPSPKPVDEIWSEHIAAITESEHKMNKARSALHEIEYAIEALDDSEERRVLKNRYYHGYNWSTIADKMHCAVSQVCKLHGDALDKIRCGNE